MVGGLLCRLCNPGSLTAECTCTASVLAESSWLCMNGCTQSAVAPICQDALILLWWAIPLWLWRICVLVTLSPRQD
jgi:hypothetical protein